MCFTDLPLEGECHREDLQQEQFIVLLNVHSFFFIVTHIVTLQCDLG
jgi:hypothetical protein